MRSFKYRIILILLIATAGFAQVKYTWNGGTGSWQTASNWNPNGIPGAYATLSAYAKKLEMNVLMSNFCGQSWGIEAGGKSAFWDKNGRLIAQLNGADTGVLLLEKDNDGWMGSSIVYD